MVKMIKMVSFMLGEFYPNFKKSKLASVITLPLPLAQQPGRSEALDPQSSSGQGGRWKPVQSRQLGVHWPSHLPPHVAATRARAVKGEVGPFVVPGPLDLHRPLLHKNLSRLGPVGPETGQGIGPCTGSAWQEGSAIPRPTHWFPF